MCFLSSFNFSIFKVPVETKIISLDPMECEEGISTSYRAWALVLDELLNLSWARIAKRKKYQGCLKH